MLHDKLLIGITGSKGTFGKIAVKKLLKAGVKVSRFRGNICNNNDIDEWVRNNDFDVILHFAAVVAIDDVEKNKEIAIKTNVNGPENLMKSLIKFKRSPWFFFPSSSHVYKPSKKSLKEEDDTEPINFYGKTKLYAEKRLKEISRKYNGKLCIARIFSVFHPTQKKSFLYSKIKKRLLKHDHEKIFELKGAHNERDFLNAEDVIDKILILYRVNYSGVVNIGSGIPTRIESFVKTIFNKPNLRIKNLTPKNKTKIFANITLFEKLTKNINF